MKVVLPEPFKYEDQELTEIDLDLKGKITPAVQEMLEDKYKRIVLGRDKGLPDDFRGMYALRPALDKRFYHLVFEYVTGLNKRVIINDEFPIEQYNIIMDTITYFFMNWREPSTELPPETEEVPSTDYGESY